MNVSRRLVLTSAATEPLLAAALPVRAETAHYPMACDPALVPALREAAEVFRGRTDIFVHMLPTAPALVVPQMTHQIQNDIVMSRADILDAVDAVGYAVPGAPRPRFRNRLVLAALSTTPDGPFTTIGITDKSPDTLRDDVAIVAGLGFPTAKTIGGIDTGEVAFLVTHGVVQAGLVLMSDVASDPRLRVVRDVPESVAASPIYIACTTRVPRRPQPESFVAFLANGDGTGILTRHGLELVA